MSRPTLIDIPDPVSNPDTPSEMPGTPNSTTTSLSVLSTTAIKDGHRGHALPSLQHPSHPTQNLEAERADRISRLAGLERVSTLRPQGSGHQASNSANSIPPGQIPGYFDANGVPIYTKRDTVGSASATDSRGFGSAIGSDVGRTAPWDTTSTDGMSVDANNEPRAPSTYTAFEDMRDADDREERLSTMEVASEDGMSEGDASLVGFGEGAGSTVSGPTYSRAAGERGNATGAETAQRILRERLERGESSAGGKVLGTPENAQSLGKFSFEERK